MMKEIQENELNFVARHFRDGLFSPRRGWRRFRRTRGVRTFAWGYAALAGAFAALVLGIFLFERNAWTTVESAATARTVVLPDRTQATLAPGATLAFYRHGFGRRNRSVRMAGKVYFAVAHQEELPFEITAAEGFVRVLGTRFQVETDSTGTRVDVVDGRVLFAHVPDGRRQGRSARKGVPVREQDGLVLTRGMHAELPSGAAQPALVPAQTANPAAWASHLFRYEDTPLSEVLQELSAQFGQTYRTDQPDRRLSGEFEGTAPDEILSLIEEALDLTITRQ